MDLNKTLKTKSSQKAPSAPVIFDLSKKSQLLTIEKLLRSGQVKFVTDDYEQQLKEFFHICNPEISDAGLLEQKFQLYQKRLTKKTPLFRKGKWIFLPWLYTLVHTLPEKEFFALRTARNKLLITTVEQEKFYNAKIGIGGLSIGGSVATALVLQGGAKRIKLADFDTLSLSNTNRIRAGVQNLGLPKTEIAARQIYEINPYAKVKTFPYGINSKNIRQFMSGLDVIIDEMDDLAVKLLIRIQAKKQKIPVVMGADNGDMAVIDIERYDQNHKTEFFNGRLKNPDYRKLKNMGKLETGKNIAQLVGLENHTQRMLMSLSEIGKTIVSWPQLGGTAMLNGAAIAYCVRKIATGQTLRSNRGIISLDENLQSDYFPAKQKNCTKAL